MGKPGSKKALRPGFDIVSDILNAKHKRLMNPPPATVTRIIHTALRQMGTSFRGSLKINLTSSTPV